MPLEELMEAIDTSVHRVVRHREALQQSGALTRTSLVEPVLRALGWDTGDPLQVQPSSTVRTSGALERRSWTDGERRLFPLTAGWWSAP